MLKNINGNIEINFQNDELRFFRLRKFLNVLKLKNWKMNRSPKTTEKKIILRDRGILI